MDKTNDESEGTTYWTSGDPRTLLKYLSKAYFDIGSKCERMLEAVRRPD